MFVIPYCIDSKVNKLKLRKQIQYYWCGKDKKTISIKKMRNKFKKSCIISIVCRQVKKQLIIYDDNFDWN